MKFLCVPCDKPMQLEDKSSDRGSISLTYGCPDCGYEFAMLTNPMETQIVGSLGITIGAEGSAGESKCPFTGMVNEMGGSGPAPERMSWSSEAEHRVSQGRVTAAGICIVGTQSPCWTRHQAIQRRHRCSAR